MGRDRFRRCAVGGGVLGLSMEIIIIAAVISVSFNVWLLRQNSKLHDRVNSLIDELAKAEYGPL